MSGAYRPPESYIHGSIVVVPARVAAWLDRASGLRRLAQQAYGDPETRSVLQALAVTSANWQVLQARGRTERNPPEEAPASTPMSTSQVATALRVTDRAVRLALEEGRLVGAKNPAGHWRVHRADLDAYRTERAA